MTYIGSLPTNLARGEVREAGRKWLEHATQCPSCAQASRSRWSTAICAIGATLKGELRDAEARLKKERELDKQAAPGQETLFDA